MSDKDKNMIDVICHTAETFGDKEAAMDPYRAVTWKELKNEALSTAAAIFEKVSPDDSGYPVAVFSEKRVELLASVMGITLAGGFYVYINPEQPAERIRKIISVLQPRLCITGDEMKIDGCPAVTFSECRKYSADIDLTAIQKKVTREAPLYGVFTSGSAGIPKCVVISHGAAYDFISRFTDLFGFSSDDIIANQAPFDFDVSVKDIVTAYFTGAKLVLIPREYFSTPPRLLDYICDAGVTSLTWAVSALCVISGLKGLEYRVPSKVKRVLFSGEVMPMKQLEIWRSHLGGARYVNLYGPSEITCNCMYYELDREYGRDEKLPLGKAFEGRMIHLLDEDRKEIHVPHRKGEICVSGESLAIGYYHDEEQTKEHFVEHTDENGKAVRMYRTGDLAEFGDDGELYFTGRKDFQIKHMGHRIELEEIERGMESVSLVDRAVCRYDMERQRLTAFYTGQIEKAELRGLLKDILPIYMIPNKFRHVKAFPLNKNGKIDRTILESLEEI